MLGDEFGSWDYAREIHSWWIEGRRAHVRVLGARHYMPMDGDPAENQFGQWDFALRQRNGAWKIFTHSEGGDLAPDGRRWANEWRLEDVCTSESSGLPEIPENLLRYPTRTSIDALAKRLKLRNEPGMQDWEYEVADPDRAEEFLQTYVDEPLSEDERFTLMETILQSFEDSDQDLAHSSSWKQLVAVIEENIDLHISTVWYWSVVEATDLDQCWRVTPFMRDILTRHYARYVDTSTT